MRGKRYRKQVVYIDPDFIDLIRSFLKGWEKEIGVIRECIARSDMKEAQRLGHGMKGAGSGYGFPEISRLGKRIEEAAKAGNTREIEDAIDMLGEYLSVIEVAPSEV